ncbi:MAG: hypothetical protein ACREM8_07005 [Vulcanimicrobiaceae bacterium]
MLTKQETEALDAIKDAWNKFVALPRCHPMELQEGCTFVHGLQHLVMVRSLVREQPDQFTHVEGFV